MKDNGNAKKVFHEKDSTITLVIVELRSLQARSIPDAATRVKAYRAVFSTGAGM